VADGAVSFYIDHLVSSRVARATYGVECFTPYYSEDFEHQIRQHKSFIDATGELCIPDYFESILLKVNEASSLIQYMLICLVGNQSF
jgi:hypothetical protein